MANDGLAPEQDQPESYLVVVTRLAVLVMALAAIAYATLAEPDPQETPLPVRTAQAPPETPLELPEPVSPLPVPPAPEPEPEPEPEPAKTLDEAAVAVALNAKAQAEQDRLRAQSQTREAISQAWERLAQFSRLTKAAPPTSERIPRIQVAMREAMEKAIALRSQRDRLREEARAYELAPKAEAKPLDDHNPYAKPAEGEEFHFEVRGNRVSHIDLKRLIDMVKVDARLRIRFANQPKTIEADVGPAGAFSMHYILGPSLELGINDRIRADSRSVTFTLKGWEIVPERPGRGETFDVAVRTASEFGRTVRLLNRERDVITLWVYPDSFALYRQLRDWLHQQGFTIAARPLPEDMPIRGSPAGSITAGQ